MKPCLSLLYIKLPMAALLIMLLLLAACGGAPQRKPPPVITIMVLDDWDAYLMDGQRVDRATLEARLQRQADLYRREITGTSRAWVRISAQKPGSSSRHEMNNVMKYCMKIGLDKVGIH